MRVGLDLARPVDERGSHVLRVLRRDAERIVGLELDAMVVRESGRVTQCVEERAEARLLVEMDVVEHPRIGSCERRGIRAARTLGTGPQAREQPSRPRVVDGREEPVGQYPPAAVQRREGRVDDLVSQHVRGVGSIELCQRPAVRDDRDDAPGGMLCARGMQDGQPVVEDAEARCAEQHQRRGVGGQGRDRTADTTIFSRVLYQLSYLTSRGPDGI